MFGAPQSRFTLGWSTLPVFTISGHINYKGCLVRYSNKVGAIQELTTGRRKRVPHYHIYSCLQGCNLKEVICYMVQIKPYPSYV